MKKVITLSLSMLITGFAAQQKYCGTDSVNLARLGNDRASYEAQMQKGMSRATAAEMRSSAATYTIPVVVHILHTGGIENLTDFQVNQAITNLNKDFNRLNPDTTLVVPAYQNLIADAQIHFQLATIDPNGNCTNGIIRHYTPNPWLGTFLDFVHTWPPDRYMNIYVVGEFATPWLTGYSSMPSIPVAPMEDAVVMEWLYFTIPDYLTHEVGHWLDLFHTWGTGPFGTCGDDGIADTPPTKGFNSCAINNAAVCNPTITENVQNNMDYGCRHMFTPGQVQKMHSTLSSTVAWRSSLSSFMNHMLTGITNTASYCIPMVEIFPFDTIVQCVGSKITVRSFTSNIAASSYSWTADNGAGIAGVTVPDATVTINNAGYTHIILTASNSNGGATQTLVVFAPNYPVQQPNIVESFEPGIVPTGWNTVSNGTVAWQFYPGAASHGSVSAYVQGESLAAGKETWLETPSYDLSSDPNAHFTFKYAYARYDSTHKDIFKVMASTDCGQSWQNVYDPSPAQLATGSGNVSSSLFVPQAAEWKFYNLGAHPKFTPLRSQKNVRFRFYFKQDIASAGNRFFLDEINFYSTVSLAGDPEAINPSVYPSPHDGKFSVRFSLAKDENVSYAVYGPDGRELLSQDLGSLSAGDHERTYDCGSQLSPGVYLLEMRTPTARGFTKMALAR